jgi:hypothetical protein
MSKSLPKSPDPAAIWIVLCVYCNCTGWILSALHQLNAAGYAVAFIFGIAGGGWFRRRFLTGSPTHRNWPKLRRRFARPFPLAFLILSALAIVGGVLYAPNNYDALAYRVPRVLQWLAHERWVWIHTDFNRLNVRADGFEWVSAPLMAFTHSDRLLFLINVISFLLLPGLAFSLFTRLGISKRVAWHWMWLFPTGYCFLLQAGSIGNDLFGAVFALAAVDFALRARKSQRSRDLWLSILAAALMTGSKSSNLPLLLPWLVAVFPSLRLLRQNLIPGVAVGCMALLVSLLPQAVLNSKISGDWTGIKAEQVASLRGGSSLNCANNSVLLTIQNLTPPIFPFANQWNQAMERIMPASLRVKLEQAFEPSGAHWALGQMQVEEDAGLGFGVTLLLLAGVAAGVLRRDSSPQPVRPNPRSLLPTLIVLSTFVALLAFMIKSGMSTIARLVTPYYALLVPAFLFSQGQALLVRTRWWRFSAQGLFVLAAVLLVLSPARPLWPANTILGRIDSQGHPLLARAKLVYSVYGQRADGFAPARKLLPPEVKVLGLIASDDPETSLWRPFGQRRIEHVTAADSIENLHSRGVEYILANSGKFEALFHRPLEQWLTEMHAEILTKVTLALRATSGSSDWFLIKLSS